MNVASIINELLFEFDCVIVPNFGGFVANRIDAKINKETGSFYAPSKQISFNSFLKHNDGLLANRIAKHRNISFEEANQIIAQEVVVWNDNLNQNTDVVIGTLGTLYLNSHQQLSFKPSLATNFLTDSFGLSQFTFKPIERTSTKVINLQNTVEVNASFNENKVVVSKNTKQRIPAFIKYAASVAILLTLGFVGVKTYTVNEQKKSFIAKQEQIEQKIQEATFVINSPLPTLNLSVAKAVKQETAFHIIAGAFGKESNAKRKISLLKQKGFNSKIVGKNKWGLFQVSYDSFETEQQARLALKDIKASQDSKAWILFK